MTTKKINQAKYREMIRLYQLPGHERDALELARELMTKDLSASKMNDVEHVYFSCARFSFFAARRRRREVQLKNAPGGK